MEAIVCFLVSLRMCLNKVIPQEHVTEMGGLYKTRLYWLSTTVLGNPVWPLALGYSELFKRQCGFGMLWELKINGEKKGDRAVRFFIQGSQIMPLLCIA